MHGFPGETDEDYLEQAAVVPHVVHLQPPSGVGQVWLERFSPYPPRLVYRSGPDWSKLIDTRTGKRREALIVGWQAQTYEWCCESYRGVESLRQQLSACGQHVQSQAIEEFLQSRVRHGVCLGEGGLYLGLALPEHRAFARTGVPQRESR
ncbi:MAG: hypothetical protein QG608_3278 [Actinomycetota bacterium]|nr:hypothetical protein [Actinomycetota bacterium]